MPLLWFGFVLLAVPRNGKRGDALHSRGNGVHGVEENQPLRCQIKIPGVEIPAELPLPAGQIPGVPCGFLLPDLPGCQMQQLFLPAAVRRKEGRQRRRIAGTQIPGVAPAAQQRPATVVRLLRLRVQTPEASLMTGYMINLKSEK